MTWPKWVIIGITISTGCLLALMFSVGFLYWALLGCANVVKFFL